MKIKVVIVDKVPESASDCPYLIEYFVDRGIVPVCRFYKHKEERARFDVFSKRCPFCPLMTEEEYKAKLEAE